MMIGIRFDYDFILLKLAMLMMTMKSLTWNENSKRQKKYSNRLKKNSNCLHQLLSISYHVYRRNNKNVNFQYCSFYLFHLGFHLFTFIFSLLTITDFFVCFMTTPHQFYALTSRKLNCLPDCSLPTWPEAIVMLSSLNERVMRPAVTVETRVVFFFFILLSE